MTPEPPLAPAVRPSVSVRTAPLPEMVSEPAPLLPTWITD